TDPCSCPTAAPADGSHCIRQTGDCSYGDTICTCGGTWRCGPRTCPMSKPSTGAPCAMQLSCTYASGFCACDGTSWTCSGIDHRGRRRRLLRNLSVAQPRVAQRRGDATIDDDD